MDDSEEDSSFAPIKKPICGPASAKRDSVIL